MGLSGTPSGYRVAGDFLPFIGERVFRGGKEELARDCGSGVVLQHLRLSTITARPLRFECHSDAKTGIEAGTVLEIKGDLWTVSAVFKERDRPDDFSSKVFAFNHGDVLPVWWKIR